jgi:hypothetical protein
MEIDWSQVKVKTLWHYEDLIKKMFEVLDYGFIQENYNHTMAEAAAYSERIQHGYIINGKEAAFVSEITKYLRKLDALGIRNYQDLVQQVDSKANCEAFLDGTGIGFDVLIELLAYLFRWVLPFKCPVKELIDTIAEAGNTYKDVLKKHKIRSNLDVLERFRTKMSRATFSKETGVEEAFILKLVHRADISRLAYVRGKTIKHLCGGGYDTLDKIAEADLKTMEADMTAYYESIGKRFSDFKMVIPLDWMIGGASVLPRVVEV